MEKTGGTISNLLNAEQINHLNYGEVRTMLIPTKVLEPSAKWMVYYAFRKKEMLPECGKYSLKISV